MTPYTGPDEEPPRGAVLPSRSFHEVEEQEKCLACGHESGAHYLNSAGRPRCGRRIGAFGSPADSICRCTKPNLNWKLTRATVPSFGSGWGSSETVERPVPSQEVDRKVGGSNPPPGSMQ